MITRMAFRKASPGPFRLLCLGAHADDIEIGAGGMITRMLAEMQPIEVTWLVFSASRPRKKEAEASAMDFLDGAHAKHIRVRNYRDGFFPSEWDRIKEEFERVKHFDPDLVLTHYREDRHQDHRVISDLAWNTFRNHFILEYEIPKYDGDLGIPNYFVEVDEATARRKYDLIHKHFESQRVKHWFSEDTILGLMRLRGLESGRDSKYAEAFHARKVVW